MGWKLCVLLSTVCFSGNRGDNTTLPHLKGTSLRHYKQTLIHQNEMEWFELDGCIYSKAGHLKKCIKSWYFVSSTEGQIYLTMRNARNVISYKWCPDELLLGAQSDTKYFRPIRHTFIQKCSCALPQVWIQHDKTSVIYKYTERKVCPSITEGTAGCETH